MRKGLVVTLGVALALSVAPAFAEAPIISCLPDIIISDFDRTAQTADTNLFVFSDALDLDEYVVDYDTPDSALRWSFIETTGNAIRINGLDEITAGQQLEPGAKDIRAASAGGNGFISLRNVAMGATSPTLVSTLEFWVSDGTATRSETVIVTTVNTNGTSGSQEDALVPPVVRRWTFDADEGWTWFDLSGAPLSYNVPTHQLTGGSLQLAKTAAATKITFGGYESPKSPTAGVQPRIGCIYRAAFKLRGTNGTATSAGFPGFRLQAVTSHMVNTGGGNWSPNFATQDYVDSAKVVWDTLSFTHVAGREPTATVKPYQILSYPFQAAETLMSTDTVTYFTCDMLDLDYTANDLGTIFIDEVTVDAIDRPELGQGTQIDALTSSSFATASWTGGKNNLQTGGYNDTGLITAVNSGALSITIAPGNQGVEAFMQLNNGVALQSGKFYRLNWQIACSVAAGSDNIGPRVRVGLQSSRFIWLAHKDLDGGGLVAVFDSTPKDFELWAVAPSELSAGLTEAMRPIFESWLTASNTSWPFYKNIAGTSRAVALTTEVFEPVPVP